MRAVLAPKFLSRRWTCDVLQIEVRTERVFHGLVCELGAGIAKRRTLLLHISCFLVPLGGAKLLQLALLGLLLRPSSAGFLCVDSTDE